MSKGDVQIKLAKVILIMFLIIAIAGPFIAHKSPLLCFGKNKTECLMPILTYDGTTLHTDRKHISPFEDIRHPLGTDVLGRDVMAGIIGGSHKSLLIGILSSILSAILGCMLGIAAGYYRDDRIKTSKWMLGLWLILWPIIVFYSTYELLVFRNLLWWWVGLIAGTVAVMWWMSKVIGGQKDIHIPVDLMVTKLIEIRKSIPSLFLVLAILPLFARPTIWNIIVVLTLFMWSEFARFARAEVMRIRGEHYIKRVEQLGLSDYKIMVRHLLPNMLPTILVVFCFSCAACILAESSISFLGIGLGPEEVTWGSMLSQGRKTMVWWMVVFPGLCIFMLIWALNTLAVYYQSR
jgi:peptide/nickel transport system permease protein